MDNFKLFQLSEYIGGKLRIFSKRPLRTDLENVLYFVASCTIGTINQVTRSGATTIICIFNCFWLHYFFRGCSKKQNLKKQMVLTP